MTDLSRKPAAGDNLLRFARLDYRKKEGEEVETFEASLSSGKPYQRWFGIEILRHDEGSVDLARAEDGLPLLFGHDAYQPGTLIGRAHNLRVEGGKLRAELRFFSTDEAQKVATAVREGHREMSIGYEWLEYEEKRGEGGAPDVFTVTKWRIFEASIVSVPADYSVGVGRQFLSPATPPAPAAFQPARQEVVTMETPAPAQTQKPEELERARSNEIIAAGETYAKYLKPNDVAEAVRGGWTTERFKDLVMKRIEERHSDTKALQLGMTVKEVRRYSFGRALQATLSGDWSKAGFERECSQALAQMLGRQPEGFYVPFEAWQKRDFNVGTGSEAGNLVATDLRTDLWVDVLRNSLVMGRLGARILTGLTSSLSVPRKATSSTLGTLTEIGSASETSPTTAALALSPKRVGAFVEVSKQAIIQSALSVEDMIRDDLLMGAAVQIENLALNGAGTGAEHAGIRNTVGIGTVVAGSNGLAPTWGHIVDLETKCTEANAEPDRLAGYALNAKTRGKLKQTQQGTNLPMIYGVGDQPLNGYRVAVTNNLAANLTKGTSTTVCSTGIFSSDWSHEILAFFGAPDVTVDPYSKADTGQVKITLNQFADSGVRQPKAFAKVDDWLS